MKNKTYTLNTVLTDLRNVFAGFSNYVLKVDRFDNTGRNDNGNEEDGTECRSTNHFLIEDNCYKQGEDQNCGNVEGHFLQARQQ